MQNVQNVAEIQQRVINLVELYRTKVGKESETAVKAKQFVSTNPFLTITDFGPIDMFRVDEQLAGHFYSVLAGDNADERILRALLPELPNYFDDTIFSQDDVKFLMNHFKEMVDYITKNPSSILDELYYTDYKTAFLIPDELLKLISERISLSKGSIVYNPFAGYAQFACLFKDCKFYCEETYSVNNVSTPYMYDGRNRIWGWMMVMLYANQIDAIIIKDGNLPVSYDAVMAFVPYVPTPSINQKSNGDKTEIWGGTHPVIRQLHQSYENLRKGGEMILICPCSVLFRREGHSYPLERFWEQLIAEASIKEIIQLPKIMSHHTFSEDYCLLIIEKESVLSTTLIDARFAKEKFNCFSESDFLSMGESLANVPFGAINVDESLLFVRLDREIFNFILDSNAFNGMIENEGIDCVSGLRKMEQIPFNELQPHLLLPVVYVTEKPSAMEHPVPMSRLCSFETSHIYDVQSDLPEDTPWVVSDNLSPTYSGPLSISSIRKAGLPNNPKGWKYGTQILSPFSVGAEGSRITDKDIEISDYRNCYYLDGSKDAVLFKFTKDGFCTAVVRATGKAVAVDSTITVLYPDKETELLSLLASINLPIVYRQIQVYIELGIMNEHLKDILVPSKKLIIQDEKQRLLKYGNAISELKERIADQKKAVRMRKHALTQSLSSIEAMFNALNSYRIRKEESINNEDVISRVNGTTVSEAFEFISSGIKDMMPALEHIADVEYSFAKPSWNDPEQFIEDYITKKEKGWLNFKPIITWAKGHNQVKEDILNPTNGETLMQKGQSIYQFMFPKDALELIFKNIISNAKAWAFNDQFREDYQLKFSWHIDDTALIVEIENNGTPIPNDRDTSSLLKYGVSTALHHDGHNGIGCNEIVDIMQRYDGKVKIVSTPENEFTVKYVLAFNRYKNNAKKQ